jgi:hypothetical protein
VDNGVLPRPVALQLYTFRELPISYPEVLALTAEIGFAGVKGSGLQGLSSSPGARGLPMTALGEGVVDLPAALSANAAARWHIIEIDDTATDMVEAVRASYRYLVDGRFSYGRLPADQR